LPHVQTKQEMCIWVHATARSHGKHAAQDALQHEVKEADVVTAVCPLGAGAFAYGLTNCTIGVYRSLERSWRVKSKHAINCFCAHELPELQTTALVSGWQSGKVSRATAMHCATTPACRWPSDVELDMQPMPPARSGGSSDGSVLTSTGHV
jgi:hypothetical protein